MTRPALFPVKLVVLLALLSSITGSLGTTFARASQASSSQSQSGVELYERGNFPQAVKVPLQYTEEARPHQTTGTIILRAVPGQDGQVHVVIPIKSLPDGLTEKAISAARRITFEPATKDGRPVPVVLRIEYNFNLY